MTVVVVWLLLPLLLGLVCLGCGLLLEAAAGIRLPRPLVLPAGLATVIVIAQVTTAIPGTARATTPVVVAAALAGIALRPPWRTSWRALRWPLAAAIGVFVLYAAPIVLSGQATFAGYIKLDDTATWFAITDRVMGHGRDVSGLPESTYHLVLKSYIGTGYPVGAFLPLGIGHQLTGQDIAWVFQPYLAFLAAMVSLSLYWIARTVLPSSRLAALASFAAPLAAVTYGYSLWGGAKELMGAALVTLAAALAADAAREARTGRQVLPVAVATAAALSAMSAGAAIWLGPLLLGALGAGFMFQRRDVPARQAAAFLPFAAVLAIPAISAASTFVSPGSEKTLTSNDELGNLARPLKAVQALGIWPTGDFRTNPVQSFPAYLLIGVLLFCIATALVLALRRRSWELPLAVVGVAIALLVVAHFGSPWVDGKAMATAAPVFILAGMAGAGMVFVRGRRLEGAILGVAILFGVLWSDALAYRDVSLAPRHQLSELQHIGKLISDTGPTLMDDYEPYGVRHFLRASAPEAASEFRWRQVTLRNGTLLPKGQSADIDSFKLDGILVYRNLVLHRGPTASRPPAPYKLLWKGDYYEVWQRPVNYPQVIDHLPLGDDSQPGAVPACATILAEASRVPEGGRLAAVIRDKPTIVPLRLSGPGSGDAGALVRQSGTYSVWLGGSWSARVRVYIDGKLVGARRNALEWERYQQMGSVRLTGGTVHDVRVVYDGSTFLHPGSGNAATPIGPLALARQTADVPVTYVPAARARSLCGKNLDWVEALGPG
jgi:hypothetical protein